jgi:hypothetical protein
VNESMTLAQVADRLGVTVLSARLFHNQATRRRREGRSNSWDMPAPDLVVGRSPRWFRETIEEWVLVRPRAGKK